MTGEGRMMIAVASGAALGSVARHLASTGMQAAAGPASGTLLVNVSGSFLIGLLAALSVDGGPLRLSLATRHFLITGFCGGFTTFSIFSLETVRMAAEGAHLAALTNVVASLSLWIGGAWAGSRLGSRLGAGK